MKSTELANLCTDTIGEVADATEVGLERVNDDAALRFAFLRQCGLRL